MDWIKKNLLFVVGLAVSVVLLIGAVLFLFQASDAKEQAGALLQEKNQQLDALVKREVYPNRSNVEAAKAEQKRVSGFIRAARASFGSFETAAALDNASFKSLLESTIATLERQAGQSGVKLPGDKFSFTFGEQRKQLQLPANTLAPLARQLSDVEHLCQILFAAKVHSLVSLKRSSVGTNETFGNSDILSKKTTTNTVVGAAIFPYEVTFQCFSSELSEVIDGLRLAGDFYLLKTINIEPAGATDPSAAGNVSTAVGGVAGPGGMDPALAARYGLGGRYGGRYGGGAAQPAPTPAVAPTKPNEPVLDEKPLKVTMGVEVIKLAAKPDGKKQKSE